MRQRFEQQLDLGLIPIAEVKIPLRSRDELPPVLAGLQHIFVTPELNRKVFAILEDRVCRGKKKTGRPGMDLWEILVLGVVRLALDCDYDRLEQLANYEKLIRSILGVETTKFGTHEKVYPYQTIRDNVTLLDEETISQISALVVEAGHRVVKKKEDQGLKIKADTYVLETNVHYPTDTNLLWDSGRKCLDVMQYLSEDGGLDGWRKHRRWRKDMKNAYREVTRASHGGGKNKETRIKGAVMAYLAVARALDKKITWSLENYATTEIKIIAAMISLDYYQEMLRKHIDLVDRRLLKGEGIPHEEKVFSIFEPHSEWLAKGKAGKPVEIGHKVLIATDQYQFILHHQVIESQSDYHLAVPLAKQLVEKYKKIESLSFDKGFYSKDNKAAIADMINQVIMPKKGRLSEADKEEESSKTFKLLKRKHSAVESNINQLESNGLNRCPDKGITGYKRYTAFGVLSYNLHHLGVHLLEAQRNKARKDAARKAA